MIRITVLLTVMGLLNAPLPVASFDCAKAKTLIEKTICNNPALNEADSRLGRLYKQVSMLFSGVALKRIKADQQAWLPMREVSCLSDDAECLPGVYEDRIRFLEYRLSPIFGSSSTGEIGGQHFIGESMTLRVYPISEEQVAITIDGAEFLP